MLAKAPLSANSNLGTQGPSLKCPDSSKNVEEHKATGARLRTKPRKQWRFEALFADGSLKWLSWAEANQQAALDSDRYAEIHPELNIPKS